MIAKTTRIAALVAAAGASVASAQPTIVSGSGATLLETLWRSSAVTNDFIDVDANGTSGAQGSFLIQQLAPLDLGPVFGANAVFGFTYRFVGSGNGIREFDTYAGLFDVCPDGSDMAAITDTLLCNPAADFDAAAAIDGNAARADDGAVYNRADLNNAGVLDTPPSGIAVPGHRGGAPFVSNSTTFQAELLNPATGGFTVDFSSADVPISWFAIQAGAGTPLAAPSGPGYGSNPRLAQDKDGTVLAQTNLLRPLVRLNTDGSNPALQVFDTPLALVPVAAFVNYGAGIQEIDQSDLRHAKATGRRVNGENLVIVTRDSGSGTRNAFMNGISIDPSWGIGENIGTRNGNNILGPNYLPSNKSGSGNMDTTVRNTRLAIGHSGAERGVNRGLIPGQMNVLGIRFDVKGGTDFVRPTQAAVIDGGPNGYSVVGPSGIGTVGQPRAAAPEFGGWGWDPDGIFDGRGPDGILGNADDETALNNPFAGVTAPANDGLSAFVNNITRSLDAFEADPGGPDTEFQPGEFIALNFFPTAAPDSVPANPDADGMQPIAIEVNGAQNANVRDVVLNDPSAALNNSAYDAFDTTQSGLVPQRETGVVYSDGVAGGANYIDQAGNAIVYGGNLTDRNRIAFDFNGDGVRSLDDAADMLAAYDERFGSGTAWVAPAGTGAIAGAAGSDAIIEVLGDAQGDGNFDDADIRYWADGLALVGGSLDRMAGFMAVDDAFGGNFFNTSFGGTLATSYESGDSAADIAGGLAATPGWAPNGSDLVIDLQDVDYIQANFGDFTDLEDAAGVDGSVVDLSADMNADLVVDALDALKVIEDIMGTSIGDLDLDGDVDGDDLAIANANVGTGTTYSQGDLDFDGDVDNADLALFGCNAADIALPFGILDLSDIDAFILAFASQDPTADITAPFGIIDLSDIDAFIVAFLAGCP
ncbi:MAG: GC-type dockerin domain-anchored protein [Planctomycetota bacterium]